MSNYEAYKPSTGAMGDRLSAMKAAFQVSLITRDPQIKLWRKAQQGNISIFAPDAYIFHILSL